MKNRVRRLTALLLAVFMVSACTGCVTSSAEELYSLPQLPEEYVQLQELIGQRIAEGGAYAAPTGGNNRQSIQLQDLDGDGTAEALAFLTDSDRTPSICIYRQNERGDYYLYVIITGDGSSVASVEYADVNGDRVAELIIAWQISGDIRLLSVYALGGDDQAQGQVLMSVDCSEFMVGDLDGDGVEDLLDLRIEYGGWSSLEMYTFDRDGEIREASAPLSAGITSVRRARAGTLSDGAAALFVESDLGDEGLVTDVFTAQDGDLRNITMTDGQRSDTLRTVEVFATDIDNDGAMELPMGDDESDLTWHGLNAAGERHPVMTTCYDSAGGWYLVLTGPLLGELTVETAYNAAGERQTTFTVQSGTDEPPWIALIIYEITGENRLDRAAENGRFLLQEGESAAYAAELFTDELTAQEIQDGFNLIYAEWQSGDL